MNPTNSTFSVDELVKKIESVLMPVEDVDYAFLFGSALRRLLPQSDIDILIGGNLNFDQRLLLASELSMKLKRIVDIVLTSEARCELVLKAMSQGKPIFVRKRETLKEDYVRNVRKLDDNTKLRRIRQDRIRKQYTHGR